MTQAVTEIDCSGTGQDGATQVGAELPVPRFTTDYYGLTVVDNLTGLMWTFDSRTPDPYDPDPNNTICAPHGRSLSWEEALDYIACLNAYSFLGYNDWRLPNREELRSLIFDYSTSGPALPAGWPFINVESGYTYWSSTSSFDCSETGIGSIHMWSGSESSGEFVWPVRAGVTDGNPDPTSPVNLRKTGQTAICYPGDDGDTSRRVSHGPTHGSR